MSTVASHKTEPRFEIVQDEANSVGELQQLKKQIARLEQENAELQALLEQDALADIWVGAPEPTMRHCVTASPIEFVPYFSTIEFED